MLELIPDGQHVGLMTLGPLPLNQVFDVPLHAADDPVAFVDVKDAHRPACRVFAALIYG